MLKKLFYLIISTIILFSLIVYADPRTERLINMLQESGNYRVRVQSAISLGRITDPEVVPALIQALNDPHDAVRIAVISSLGRLGDSAALQPLREIANSTENSADIREQARNAIQQIERMGALKGKNVTTQQIAGGVKFYIGIGDMGNVTTIGKGVIEKELKNIVREELEKVSLVSVAPDNESISKTKIVLNQKNLKGFFIQGSLTQLSKQGNVIMATVSIMVLTNPDRSLKVMLQGRGGEGIKGSSQLNQSQEDELRKGAIKQAVNAAISSLAEYLSSL